MLFVHNLRAVLLSVLFTTALGSTSVQAADNPLYDWQPCPSSLGADGGAEPAKKWDLTISPYTHHWSNNPEHKDVVLVAIDEQLPGDRLCGISFFTNSFGQPSTYLYVGQRWNPLPSDDKLFLKVTAGVLYGYVGVYRNKVPLNHNGFSPAVIPSLGYMFTRTDSAQVLLLGTAGIMVAYGHRF